AAVQGNLETPRDVAVEKVSGDFVTLTAAFESLKVPPQGLMGKYEFEVRVLDSVGKELSAAKAETGMFDDAYIETCKGMTGKGESIEGKCITKGSSGGDGASLHECDVYSQKRKELQALKTPAGEDKRKKVQAAYAKATVNEELCKYDDAFFSFYYGLGDGCAPEEVDRVWKEYLAEIGRPDDYDCVKPLSSESDNVCRVKRQVVTTLLDKGWKDVRVSKGWETNV
ncbi:hypothetical protein HYU18_01695, partial [Candidatus Woesearchaeota archaeon]|nr:hypothetical protein [Candidatus Woesearchaeota archaeon]